MRAAQLGFQKPPAVKTNPEFEANKAANSGLAEESVDFTKLMQSSNAEREKELAKEREATAGGELNIGETKTDKEFREMLEKMTGKKQEKLKNKLDKDDYLNLMVTQLKHQDPTKPMDNQEMAQQLAQFNTVEQLMAANQTLQKMANGQAEAKIDKLSPFLGKTVQVGGNKVRVGNEGQTSNAHFELPDDVSTVSFSIKDATGKVVRTDSQTQLKKGEHDYKWDGRDDKGNKMGSGEYTVAIEGVSVEGKPVKAKQTFMAKVTEITDLATGGKLGTTVGTIETKDILAIKADEAVMNIPDESKMPAIAAAASQAAAPIGGVAAAPAMTHAQKAEAKPTADTTNAGPKVDDQKEKAEARLAEHKARRKAAAEAEKAAAPSATASSAAASSTDQPTASKKEAKFESAKTDSSKNVEKSDKKKA